MPLVEEFIPSSDPHNPQWAMATYTCCRDWLCAVFARMGHCGICGERPERKQ